jgi:hypothetical protein
VKNRYSILSAKNPRINPAAAMIPPIKAHFRHPNLFVITLPKGPKKE